MHFDSDMLYIAQLEKGKKLYHYTTINALINIVKENELWITKWDYLNDVDEFRVALDACKEVLKDENVRPEIIQDIANSTNENLYVNSLLHDYFVLSFSWDRDSQLLWSNYSNYDGVNLEVDFEKLIENLDHRILWHGLVNYSFDSQKECLRKTFYDELLNVEEFGKIKSLNEINRLEGREYEMLIVYMSIICTLYSMFFKRYCFVGEKEYRFVLNCGKKDKISFRSKNGIVIPYIVKSTENIDYITGITIGPTNQVDIAAKGISELLHYYQRDVDIVKSQIPLRY